jgi:hypothetical protein
MTILNDLPHAHELRNTPLGEINAESRWKGSETGKWVSVHTLSKQMQKATFNQLGECWHCDYWRVEK